MRNFPAAIDYTARVVAWFDQHLMQPKPDGGRD
jgi:hypothetical protein